MTQLESLLQEVKDEKLPLERLEALRDQLIHLRTALFASVADLKKKRALFLASSLETSVAAKKVAWEASEDGQRLIELQGYLAPLKGEVDSLQGRIYGQLRLHG